MLPITTPYEVFFDLDGKPLDNGYIYFGQPNQNPETSPVTVYWDEAGTIPASQPIRTSDGYIYRNGSPANVFIDGEYSILVRDKKHQLVSSAPSSFSFDSGSTLASPYGAALVGFSHDETYPAGTLGAKAKQVISVADAPYNAACDGIADDSDAVEAAYAALPIGGALFFPGFCRVTRKLTFSGQKRPLFYGNAPSQSGLLYDGAVTNDDCFVFGNGSAEEPRWQISNMSFRTNVVTSAGAGARFRKLVRSTLENVWFGDQDWVQGGGARAYIGVWFDAVDMVSWDGVQARGSQECVRVNGTVGSGPKADFFMNNGKIGGAVVGLHVGGGFGGLYVDSCDIIGNTTNVLIDQAVVAEANRETFFGPGALIDSGVTGGLFNGTNLYVNDSSGYIFLDGTWVASAGTLLRFGSSFTGTFRMDGGILFNALTADGGPGYMCHIENPNPTISFNGTVANTINGVGFICTHASAATTIAANNFQWLSNPPTKYSNVNTLTGGAVAVTTARQSVLGRVLYGVESTFGGAVDGTPKVSCAVGSSGGSSHVIGYFGNSTSNGWLELLKSRSDTFGAHVIVQNGDPLGGINFAGSDGAAYQSGARIRALVSGAPASGDMPTALEFLTRASGGSITARAQFQADGTFRPSADNTYSNGAGSFRWSVVYAATGAINTSDERTKQQIIPIDDAALRAWAKVNFCQFKFNDAVETKGEGARWHFGVIAQQVKDAFESEGLDPFAYGLLCYDEWEDVYEPVYETRKIINEDGVESHEEYATGEMKLVKAAGNRYGIRYEEALALECAYLRSKS